MADSDTDEQAALGESLRLARHELKLARGEQEAAVETLQRVRRQRATLRDQVRLCSEALAQVLAARYWDDQRSSRLKNLLRSSAAPVEEQALVAEVEAAEEFDAGWYLRHHREAVEEQLSPAVHYVRAGGAAGLEPGPTFDTARYLREHPDARGSDVPPLLHHLRSRAGDAG